MGCRSPFLQMMVSLGDRGRRQEVELGTLA